jgi:hypothetical protein
VATEGHHHDGVRRKPGARPATDQPGRMLNASTTSVHIGQRREPSVTFPRGHHRCLSPHASGMCDCQINRCHGRHSEPIRSRRKVHGAVSVGGKVGQRRKPCRPIGAQTLERRPGRFKSERRETNDTFVTDAVIEASGVREGLLRRARRTNVLGQPARDTVVYRCPLRQGLSAPLLVGEW